MKALRPSTVGDEFKQAGGLTARNPERDRNPPCIEPEQRGGGGRGTQCAGGAGGMEAARIGHCRLKRGGDAAGDLEPGDDGSEEAFPAGATLFRQRQGRGKDEGLVVDRAGKERVIQFHAVRSHPVCQRRPRRMHRIGSAEQRRTARNRPCGRQRAHGAAGIQRGRVQRDGYVVYEEMLGTLDHDGRQRLVFEAGTELSECLRRGRLRAGAVRWRRHEHYLPGAAELIQTNQSVRHTAVTEICAIITTA